MLQPPVPTTPPQRSWLSLATSFGLHAGGIALAVLLSRQPAPEPGSERAAAPSEERRVDMVYLQPPPEAPAPVPPEPPPAPEPPPEPPAQPPPPVRRSAPPEQRQAEPERRANAPPDAERVEGEGEPEAGGPRAEAPRREAVTMESEARRIFGRPRVATRPGAGPRAVRPMEAYIPEDASKCTITPGAPRDPSTPVQFGVAEGRIFRGDDGRPLAGAHLQMLGTPYVAFTDDAGSYKFRFDMSLVDQCRTQYVRVTAKGYESRLLVLVVGRNVRSEDVRLERRGGWWR